MLCHKCNYDNKITNIRCEKCGNLLQEVTQNNITENNLLSKEEEIKTEKFANHYIAFSGIIVILVGVYLIFRAINIYQNVRGGYIIAIVMGLIAITIIIYGISMIIKGVNTNKLVNKVEKGETVDQSEVEKVDNTVEKIYSIAYKGQIIIFAVIWFAFVGFMTYKIIENDASEMGLIIIPFWLFGFYLLYMIFKKKK